MLRLLVFIIASTLLGCDSSNKQEVTNETPATPVVEQIQNTALTTSSPERTMKEVNPPEGNKDLYIDVHNHIFNGQDIDVSSYVYHQIMREIPNGKAMTPQLKNALMWVSTKLETVVHKFSIKIKDESDLLDDKSKWDEIKKDFSEVNYKALDEEEAEYFVANKFDFDEELKKAIEKDDESHVARMFHELRGGFDEGYDYESEGKKLEQEGYLPVSPIKIIVFIHKTIKFYNQIRHLSNLLGYRYKNALTLIRSYEDIDLFTPAIVDMYDPYDRKSDSQSTLKEQMELMSRIILLSNGKILPFIAYDPRRDLEKGKEGEALKLVQDAVEKFGFIGVKLYPATGFRPIGNKIYAQSLEWKGNDVKAEEVDKRLRVFYKWCVDNGVPILTHSNNSMGYKFEYDHYGHPVYWEEVFKEKDFKNLYVNFGHFGGIEDLAVRMGGDWPWFILKMMKKYEGVYADLSNYGEMAGGTIIYSAKYRKKHAYFQNLSEAIAEVKNIPGDTGGTYDPLDKLLYGTDWHMLDSEVGYKKYPKNMVKLYQKYMPEGGVNRLMGGNALNFLMINKATSTNRNQWLKCFIKHNNLSPAWLDSLPENAFLKTFSCEK